MTGLIKKNGKVLVGERPEEPIGSELWEFPGGKIEMGESPQVALHRELQEEIGIDAQVGPLKMAATHIYGETGIIILFYEVQYWKGEPRNLHHHNIKWIDVDELNSTKLPEANRKVLPEIISALKSF